ncbi:MAG: exodeoxyribonuclease III [Patescibacteria group bacterium]
MNIISWNVNGVRANHKKDIFLQIFKTPSLIGFPTNSLDIVALQETKATYHELDSLFSPSGYVTHHNSATERKGYSGVSVYVKEGIKHKVLDQTSKEFVSFETLKTEGRLLCLEFEDFFLINCYFPNGGGKPERLEYKMKFYADFIGFCNKLKMLHKKHIVFCGDLNIAHNEIDLARPKENEKHVGFLRQERDLLDKLHTEGYQDVFRHMYPDKVEYSWWDMKTRARDRNIGWRIDGFYVDSSFMGNIKGIEILGSILGSDHCPILLDFKKGVK